MKKETKINLIIVDGTICSIIVVAYFISQYSFFGDMFSQRLFFCTLTAIELLLGYGYNMSVYEKDINS